MSSLVPPGAVSLVCLAAGLACASGASSRAESPAWTAPADTAGLTRVRFARGTTSGILDDSLAAGEEKGYLLGALQGQVMLVHAIAWADPRRASRYRTSVRVFRPDGPELTAPGGAGPLWTGRLPLSGDYVVRVSATGEATPYTLAVQIPRRVVVDRDNPTAAFSGVAPSRAPVDYIVRGDRGRTLEVDLRSNDDGTHVHIYGLDDGVQLARLPDRVQRYRGELPGTQDYVVSVVPAAEGTRYELLVTLR